MFSRRERLPRAAFSTLARAKRRSNEHFTTLSPLEGEGYAVVISKKTLPLSVDRHRLKRRVLGALERLPGRPKALVVYPKATAIALTPLKMAQALAELL